MKVTIRSNNPVRSDQVKLVIDELNEKYADLGIVVKNMTMYVRFQDETGKTVEPMEDGHELETIVTFKSTIPTDQVKDNKNDHDKLMERYKCMAWKNAVRSSGKR